MSYKNTRPATNCLPKTFTYVAVPHTRARDISAAADGGDGNDDGYDDEHGLTRIPTGPPGGLPAIEQVRPAVGGQNGCRRAQTEISLNPYRNSRTDRMEVDTDTRVTGARETPSMWQKKTSDCFPESASATLYNISNHHTYTTTLVQMLPNYLLTYLKYLPVSLEEALNRAKLTASCRSYQETHLNSLWPSMAPDGGGLQKWGFKQSSRSPRVARCCSLIGGRGEGPCLV